MGFRGADVARAVAGFVARYWAVAALLIGWEAWVVMGGLNPIVMPRPSHVLAEILKRPSTYFGSALETLLLASVGLALGMLLGIAIAAAAWMSRILTGLLTPITLIFSSVPVIALIPVIARVLGYDVRTVLAIVVIISFFPAFVFAAAGLRALPPGSGDLFQVLGARRVTTLYLLALPSAVPNLMIAFRLAASHAILAAMVAEFLMGTSGLGNVFHAAKDEFNMERALGASAIATVISVLAFLFAATAERHMNERWR
jgi:ABC-type nitrate/sulfonate/bicarbonate transport system permease component